MVLPFLGGVVECGILKYAHAVCEKCLVKIYIFFPHFQKPCDNKIKSSNDNLAHEVHMYVLISIVLAKRFVFLDW